MARDMYNIVGNRHQGPGHTRSKNHKSTSTCELVPEHIFDVEPHIYLRKHRLQIVCRYQERGKTGFNINIPSS